MILTRSLLHAGFKLFVVVCHVKEQILSGGDWVFGVHLQFIQEHSMQSLHHSLPLSLFAPSLIVQFFLLSFWNAKTYKQLFLCSWHQSLLTSKCGELWHTCCMLCWKPGSDTVMTEIWVTLHVTYYHLLLQSVSKMHGKSKRSQTHVLVQPT